MGTFSIWHWLVVAVIVLLLFGGRGKLPALARDLAQSITSFKKGLKKEGEEESDPKHIAAEATPEVSDTVRRDQDAKA